MNRKLQGEIERVLKKVGEGVIEFENSLKKVSQATSSNQKEKYESDLKKEIKKLQRYRDQLKTWLASNEVKDKKQLVEARKLIETQMEQFRTYEKETKTKAYSKEGLGQQPKEDSKAKVRSWISKCLSNLSTQLDTFESEIEVINVKKRKSNNDQERLESLEHAVERNKFHQAMLEKILRGLENDTLTPEQIDEVRDGVEYFIENNQEADFYEDEELYEGLGLKNITMSSAAGGGDESDEEEEEDATSPRSSAPAPSAPATTVSAPAPTPAPAPVPAQPPSTPAPSTPAGPAAAPPAAVAPVSQPLQPPRGKEAARPPPGPTVAAVTAQSIKAQPAKVQPPAATPPVLASTVVRKGQPAVQPITAAAAVVAGTVPVGQPPARGGAAVPPPARGPVPKGTPGARPETIAQVVSAHAQTPGQPSQPAVPQAHAPTPAALPHQPYAAQVQQPAPSTAQQPQLPPGVAQPPRGPVAHPQPAKAKDTHTPLHAESFPAGRPGVQPVPAGFNYPSRPLESVHRPQQFEPPVSVIPDSKLKAPVTTILPTPKDSATRDIRPPQLPLPSAAPSSLLPEQIEDIKNVETFDASGTIQAPGSLADLAASTQEIIGQPLSPRRNLNVASPTLAIDDLSMLDTSLRSIPEASDSDRPRQYTPKNPYITAAYYPQQPLPVFENPALFEKFDTDTLFFIFYYQQGTFQQYLAARELKKHSWRYHKKYLTWFQRHEEPKEITNEYEQGTYVYFDYETGWCQRKKTEFTFEYR